MHGRHSRYSGQDDKRSEKSGEGPLPSHVGAHAHVFVENVESSNISVVSEFGVPCNPWMWTYKSMWTYKGTAHTRLGEPDDMLASPS